MKARLLLVFPLLGALSVSTGCALAQPRQLPLVLASGAAQLSDEFVVGEWPAPAAAVALDKGWSQGTAFTFDFTAAGGGAGPFLSMAAGKNTLWELGRAANGKVELQVAGNRVLTSTAPLAGKCAVALSFWRESINSVGAELRADGEVVGHGWFDGRTPYVGQRLDFSAGEKLRLSRVRRRFYPAPLPGGNNEVIELDGRKAAQTVTKEANLARGGQFELEVQPLDWDNHCDLPPNDTTAYVDKMVPLVEVVGQNNKVLASWTLNRSINYYDELPDFHPGKWTHVALQFEAEKVAIYLDGNYVFPGSRRGLKFDKKNLAEPVTAVRLNSGRVRTLVRGLKCAADKGVLPAVAPYKPTWPGNQWGVLKSVPAPWTPLAVAGNSASCWSTRFTVGPGGFPASMVTRGKELLAAPVSLTGATAAGPLTWTPGATTEPWAVGQTSVQWSGVQRAGDLEARLNATLEFDGMIRHELTLVPKGTVRLDSLQLEIPLKDAEAPLLHAMSLGSEGSYGGAVPAGTGRVWDSATAYKEGKWRKNLTRGSFVPMLWTGSEERGLSWFADNDKGWFPDDAVPAVELIRDKGTLTLRLNLSGAAEFSEPRTIVFGLIPTPAKPAPAAGRSWQRGGTAAAPQLAQLGGCFDGAMSAANENFSVYPIRGWDWAQEVGQRRRQVTKGTSANMLYMSAYWIGEQYRDWRKYASEWETSDLSRAHFTPSYCEYLASEFEQWYGLGILDGVYVDEVYPTFTRNIQYGGAYLLPDGKVQPGGSLFQEREFFKRLYAISLAHGKEPLIVHHMSDTMVPALASFATATLDGEANHTTIRKQSQWLKKDGPDFVDIWDPERIRAMNLGAGGGTVPLWLPMLDEKDREPAWRRTKTRSMLALLLLHDVWTMFDRCDSPFIYRFTGPCLRSFDIADPGVTFIGYWKKPVTVDNANVKVSVYRKEGRYLLVASNLGPEAAVAHITVPGMTPKAVSDLEASYDAANKDALKPPFETGPAPSLEAGGVVSVSIARHDYRLLAVE